MASHRRKSILRRLRSIRRTVIARTNAERRSPSDVVEAEDLIAQLDLLSRLLNSQQPGSNIWNSKLLSAMGKSAQLVKNLHFD